MGAESAEDEAEFIVGVAAPIETAKHEEAAAGRDLAAHPCQLVGHRDEREFFPPHRRVIRVAAAQAAHRGVDLLECRRRQADDPVVGLDEVLAQPDRPSARTIRRLECHEPLLPSCRRSCAASSSPPVCCASPAWPLGPRYGRGILITFIVGARTQVGSARLARTILEVPMVRWFAAFAFIFIVSMIAPPGSDKASAQDAYPTRSVKFLVPYPSGGTNDVLARIVGDKLQAKWGQPVIIENRSGGSGNIGAAMVAQSEPDGYTLMVSATPPLATNQSLYKELSYKPEEFVPITNFGSVPNLVIVRKGLPVNSLSELIAYAKASPGKLVYGSQGAGNTPHLTA